jgi:hypothetical protein
MDGIAGAGIFCESPELKISIPILETAHKNPIKPIKTQ